jgi:hypothetical protein
VSNGKIVGAFPIVKVSIKMEKNKSIGPDGFPIKFYQACWDVLK